MTAATETQTTWSAIPLDLGEHFNFDPSTDELGFERAYADDLSRLPSGSQVFRGIPFRFGARTEPRRWIAAGEPVAVGARVRATQIVFAHACAPVAGQVGRAELDLWERAGEELGRYVIVHADGTEQVSPVRRRFEVNEWIGTLTPPSFASVPQSNFEPVDWRGPHALQSPPQWGLPGSSSMKALPGSWAVNQGGIGYDHGDGDSIYWLSAVEVAASDEEIAAIRIEGPGGGPTRSGLIVGAITCLAGAASPFRYRPARTLEIEGPDVDATAPVAIDLGVVGPPRRRPAQIDAEEWLRETFVGWGDAADAQAPDGILLEVAGTADATLSVGGLSVPLSAIEERDVVREGSYTIRVIPPSDRRLRVSIVDAKSGRPTPARVHVHAADGRYLPPEGHRDEINLALMEDYGADLQIGGVPYAYVDGTFEISLPVGETYWEIARGFETTPVRKPVPIDEGTTELRFELERWIDTRPEGWVSADTHSHFVPPATAMLEARAEGLNAVHVLATQWGYLFSTIGDVPFGNIVDPETETAVWVGQEQRQPFLGHMSLLNAGSLIFPIGHGGEPTSGFGGGLRFSMADASDRCRAQGGLVVSPHFPFPYGEIVADVVLGKIDAIEIFGFTHDPDGPRVRDYYRLLNCGCRVPLVGGTDKMSAGTPFGAIRTYAQLHDGDTFGWESWSRAVREGRTFESSGPIVGLSVEGHGLGSVVSLPSGGGRIAVEASAAAAHDLERLEVVVNGSVVATADASGERELRIEETIAVEGTSWVAARCTTPYSMRTAFPTAVAAHTSPIYVQCGDRRQVDPADAETLLTMIDGGAEWLQKLAVTTDADRARLAELFSSARQTLERAILDARASG